jgi:hypothetical protein
MWCRKLSPWGHWAIVVKAHAGSELLPAVEAYAIQQSASIASHCSGALSSTEKNAPSPTMSERGGRECWAGRANVQHGLLGPVTLESQIPMREWY